MSKNRYVSQRLILNTTVVYEKLQMSQDHTIFFFENQNNYLLSL